MKRLLILMAVIIIACQGFAQSIQLPSQNVGTLYPITITYDGCSPEESSWIGLYRVASADADYVTYQYTGGNVSGEMTFEGRIETGYYNFRMFSGNGYDKIFTSQPFLIRQGAVADPSFNSGGIFTVDASLNSLDDRAIDVVIAPDQKIVVAGEVKTGVTGSSGSEIVDMAVMRFTDDGQPDNDFGTGGSVVTNFSDIELFEVKALLVQPDRKIVVGGSGFTSGGACSFISYTVLVRYLENGNLDTGFGNNGVVFTNFTWPGEPGGYSSDRVTCLALQPDGKILLGGFGTLCDGSWSPSLRGIMARYLTNGSLDPDFGTFGKITVFTSDINYPESYREKIEDICPPVNMETGKIYAAVTSGDGNMVHNRYITYKFNLDGSFDPAFGYYGAVVDSLPGFQNNQYVHSIKTGPDQFLYLLGSSSADPGNFWIMKKDPVTGLPVSSFGENGFASYNIPYGTLLGEMGFFNNRIYIGHSSLNTYISVTSCDFNGQYEIAFGTSLSEMPSESIGAGLEVASMAIQPDGKLVLCGSSYSISTLHDFLVARLMVNTEAYQDENQTITLKAGWNGISSYLTPAYTALADFFEPLGPQMTAAQDMYGIYYPGENIQTISEWNYQSGYMVKVTQNIQLPVTGFIPDQKIVYLSSGWNLAPVLSENPVTIADALGEYLSYVVMIQDAAGTAVYWPAYNISTLQSFMPGKAYLIYMSDPGMMEFD